MNEQLKDILSNLNADIDQETLLLYLQGKLNPNEQHVVEKGLMDKGFEADALEGLQKLKDDQKLALIVEGLNKDLKKKTQKRSKIQPYRQLKSDPWLWIALAIILLLIVISYIIIHRQYYLA